MGFVVVQRRSPAPLVPGHYLSDRVRLAAIVSAGAMGFAFYGTMLFLSITMQTEGRLSALDAGVGLLPLTVASVAGRLFAYRVLS